MILESIELHNVRPKIRDPCYAQQDNLPSCAYHIVPEKLFELREILLFFGDYRPIPSTHHSDPTATEDAPRMPLDPAGCSIDKIRRCFGTLNVCDKDPMALSYIILHHQAHPLGFEKRDIL